MKHTGEKLTSSEGRTFAVVTQAILTIILLITAFVAGDLIAEYEDMNYFGRYDDEIKMFKFWRVVSYFCATSSGMIAFAISKQNITVYEKILTGTARKTMWTNRIVEIDYNDIRDVSATKAIVVIRTRTDEIHFCINNSEYVASQIRYQWDKLSYQSAEKDDA